MKAFRLARHRLAAIAGGAGLVLAAIPTGEARADSHSCASIFRNGGAPVHADTQDGIRQLCKGGFALAANLTTKVPDWVMEDVEKNEYCGDGDRDKSPFFTDTAVPPSGQARDKDYKGAEYQGHRVDRGHQAPAADLKTDQELVDGTFVMSNVGPQIGNGFNRGVWRSLETNVREWAERHGRLVVVTGPVYDDHDQTIDNGIVVPDGYYKIVYHPRRRRAVAFLLPHQKMAFNDWKDHIVSVREIEDRTGLDFFPEFSTRFQAVLESHPGTPFRGDKVRCPDT